MTPSDSSTSSTAETPPKAGEGLGLANRITAIGHAIWLMSRSPLHRHLMVTDIEWLRMPPIMLNQFHMWNDQGRPDGMANGCDAIGKTQSLTRLGWCFSSRSRSTIRRCHRNSKTPLINALFILTTTPSMGQAALAMVHMLSFAAPKRYGDTPLIFLRYEATPLISLQYITITE